MHVLRLGMVVAVFLSLPALGCNQVRSSSVQTGPRRYGPNRGYVTIKATVVPPGAVEIGTVETYGNDKKLSDLVPKFAAEVAKMGGNFGKIDSIRTKFETHIESRMESYSCGTAQAPRTCTRNVSTPVEVATTTIMGRAFRTE